MKLALVFPGCHRRGGVERLVWEAASHFSTGHDVTVVTESLEGCGPDGTEVLRVATDGPAFAYPWRFSNAAHRAMAHRSFDCVVSFGAEFRGADVAWVNSIHRAWLQRARHEPGSVLQRYGRYARANHQVLLGVERSYFAQDSLQQVISVSDVVTEDLVRLYGLDPAIATTVHNGYAPSEFSPERRTQLRPEARASFGYDESDVVLLVVANELRRKGLATVLEAVAAVGEARLKVLLVGQRAPTEFASHVSALGLTGRFHYAGPTDDVGFMHAAADLFVLPTQYEAFCLAIVESLASGLPVVTTAVPGAGDVVVDHVTGRIQSNPRASTELAAILQSALAPGTIADWSAAAPGSVRHLAWPTVLGHAQKVLERVPSGRKPDQ